ncbi:MAG: nitroreductase family protein [Anaerolineales bacterium]|nr:nitroreductase family protein [Anaerolineales bacterium]
MDFEQLIKHRFSSRSYYQREIPEEILEKVLNAARLAPTAANRQPFQLIVINTADHEAELLEIYNRDWFVQAPLVICACGLPEQGWVRHKHDQQNYTWVDTAIAVDHLTLQAADLGLGTCWVAAFDPAAARKHLALPDQVIPIAFTPLGYPQDKTQPKNRKPLSELVRYQS